MSTKKLIRHVSFNQKLSFAVLISVDDRSLDRSELLLGDENGLLAHGEFYEGFLKFQFKIINRI